ncbi:MAG: protease family protein [Acidobacteriota bacterium]|jgi:membrane protease YdiL (CAAX protease family)|nr:protease family protein [Acidobacteriota bacterium]
MKKWAIPLVWFIGIGASLRFDPLITIGITSLALTSWLIAIESPLLRSLFRVSPRIIALGVVSTVIMLAVTFGIVPLLIARFPDFFAPTLAMSDIMRGGRTPLAALAYVLPIVVAEELIWRGAFEEWIGGRRYTTAFTCALVYALAHASRGSLMLVVIAFICGFYWSLLREASASLVPALIAHLIWDTAILLIPLA